MIRKFKAFGLALMVLGAFAAFAGSASAATFNSEAGSTIITGTNHNGRDKFTASGFEIECEDTTLKGTAAGSAESTVSLFPTYSGCNSSLGAAPVDTEGCTFVFHSTTNGTGHVPSTISCTGTSTIKVTAPGCTLSFGTQTNTTGGVKITNVGSGTTREQTTHATVTATFAKSGFGCFVIGGTTGTYEGTQTLKGYKDEGVTGDPHTASAVYKEGAQKGIWWE